MKNQKGITLIALIITIIVMLILVGVSVSTAINTGLFKTASGVSKNTQGERDNELVMSESKAHINGLGTTDIEGYVKDITTGKLTAGIEIGQKVAYVPASDYTEDSPYGISCDTADGLYTNMDASVEWTVIGKNGNKIEIIPNAVSNDSIWMNDFKNFPKILDDVCAAIYGNNNPEMNKYYTAEARSLSLNDLGYTNKVWSDINKADLFYEDVTVPVSYLRELGETSFTSAEEESGLATRNLDSFELKNVAYTREGPARTEFALNGAGYVWLNGGFEVCFAAASVEGGYYYTTDGVNACAPGTFENMRTPVHSPGRDVDVESCSGTRC